MKSLSSALELSSSFDENSEDFDGFVSNAENDEDEESQSQQSIDTTAATTNHNRPLKIQSPIHTKYNFCYRIRSFFLSCLITAVKADPLVVR